MRTALADLQESVGGRFVEFAGWELPVHYGSQIDEHHAVRQHSGCFDVSHMAVIDIQSNQAESVLRQLLVGDIANLSIGNSLYTVMLNPDAGIIDDLIVYRRGENQFRMVVNAGTSANDLAWIRQHHQAPSEFVHQEGLCIIAIQGPEAISKTATLLQCQELTNAKPFTFLELNDVFVALTGYTGEAGVELICPIAKARTIWSELMDAGVQPAGLGARDSLRLEAGLNLYGHDMTEDTSPLESRLAWTVDYSDLEREFIGKARLQQIHSMGIEKKLTGIKMTEKGIPREGYVVKTNAGDGIVTSGSFSPTLGYGIALARVPAKAKGACEVIVRNRTLPAKLTQPPFLRKKKKTTQ